MNKSIRRNLYVSASHLDCSSENFNILTFTEVLLVFLSVKISVAAFIVTQSIKYL